MRNWFLVFAGFLFVGLLLFSNSFKNKFLMDDFAILSHPEMVQTKNFFSYWDPYHDKAMGVKDLQQISGYYRPMTHIVYALTYPIFKDEYWKYHFLNLLLFVLAASFIYLLIVKCTNDSLLAFFTAFFYLIHPINGIVVNYISAGVFALQVLCLLGAILLLFQFLEDKNWAFYGISSILFLLSLLWNESGIMSPFYLFTIIFIFRKESNKRKFLYFTPYFLIMVFYILFRSYFGYSKTIVEQMVPMHLTFGAYLLALFQVYLWYMSRLFFPQGIVMQWATPIPHGNALIPILSAGLLVLFFLFLIVKFSKDKILQLGIAWFLIGLFPIGLAAFRGPENHVIIEPHWLIFSSIGFYLLVAYYLEIIIKQITVLGLLLLLLVVFNWSTISRANDLLWADQKTYASYWFKQVPDLKLPLFYLADAYQREGGLTQAEKYYHMALGIDPNNNLNEPIYNQLGNLELAQGHKEQAQANFEQALKINPGSADAYDNLGALSYAEGDLEGARRYFKHSLTLNPMLSEPRLGLALIDLKNFQYQKAIELCLQNLNINPNETQSLRLLINIYITNKDKEKLIRYSNDFIKVCLDSNMLTEVGIQLAQNDLFDLAWNCFDKAIRLDAYCKDAYLAEGILLANLEKYDQAIEILKIGQRKNPSDLRFILEIAQIDSSKFKHANQVHK